MLPERHGQEESRWFTPLRFFLLLIAFTLVFFPEVFLGLSTFYYRDYALFTYPLAHYHREFFWRGEAPLWTPLSCCGLPYLAQANTMTLYPLSLIYLLFPLPLSLGFFVLTHFIIAGLGMYFLARQMTNHRPAAALAGTVYAFNGFTLHALMWTNNLAALALMPWVIWRGWLAVRDGGRQLWLAALIAGTQWLAGSPEISGLTWGLAVVIWWLEKPAGYGLMVRRFSVVFLLGLAIAAAQMLPFIQLVLNCQRSSGFGGQIWAMPLYGWANLLVPLFHCSPSVTTGVFSQMEQQYTSSYYLGVTTLLLALVGLSLANPRRARTLMVLAVSGVLLALGEAGGFYTIVKSVCPPLGFIRYPVKFIEITLFTLPLLAAMGLAAWTTEDAAPSTEFHSAGDRRRRTLLWLGGIFAVLIPAICWWAWHAPALHEDRVITLLNGASRLAMVFILGLCLVTLILPVTKPYRKWLFLAVVGLAVVDIFTHTSCQNPTVSPEAYAPGVAKFPVTSTDGTSRVMISPWMHQFMGQAANPNPLEYCRGNRQVAFATWNLVDGVAKINGFYSLYPRWHLQISDAIYRSNITAKPLLDFMGAAHTTPDTVSFQWLPRPEAMPLVTARQQPRFAEETQTLGLVLSSNFQPRTEVILPEAAREHIKVDPDAKVILHSVDYERGVITGIQAAATGHALLVLAQTWYPNWKAEINGQPTPIWRANHAFQAVQLQPGDNQIKLRYDDPGFRWGGIISVAAIALCALGLAGRRGATKDRAGSVKPGP